MALTDIFGEGTDLNVLQMGCRGIVIFIVTLVLIRISGRRSFGIRTALDNIIVILLGAILSRAVIGASPFVPVIVTSCIIVLLHRLLARLMVTNKKISIMMEGNKILLFENGNFIENNMTTALVCKEDIMQGIRKSALTEDIARIEKVYMERNGEISAIKKTGD